MCRVLLSLINLIASVPIHIMYQIRSKLGHNATFIQLPIGLEKDCKGIIDLIEQRVLYFEGDRGLDIRSDEIPADMKDECTKRREELDA